MEFATLLVLLLLFLGVASIPWLYLPVVRAVPTLGIGYCKEILIFGFFFSCGNLSDRLNNLENKAHKLEVDLKKTKGLAEVERKRLEAEIVMINDKYRAHLFDWNNKRLWRYLFRKVPVPTHSFIAPIEENKVRQKVEARTTMYTLEDLVGSLSGFMRVSDPDRVRKIWGWRNQPLPKNQGGSSKRGNSNQQHGNNQQQAS